MLKVPLVYRTLFLTTICLCISLNFVANLSLKNKSNNFLDITGTFSIFRNAQCSTAEFEYLLEYGKNTAEKFPNYLNIFYLVQARTIDQLTTELDCLRVFIVHMTKHYTNIEFIISIPFEIREFLFPNFPTNLFSKSYRNNDIFVGINLGIAVDLSNTAGETCNISLLTDLTSTIVALKSQQSKLFSVNGSKLAVGLLYNSNNPRSLLKCGNILSSLDFVVDNVEFEAFVESYNLLKRSLDEFHERNLKFMNRSGNPILRYIYYIKFNCVDITTYCNCASSQLVAKWVSEANTRNNIDIVVPSQKSCLNKFIVYNESINQSLIIPSILENGINNDENIKWFERNALHAIKSKFNNVILTVGQWKTFYEDTTSKYQGNFSEFPGIIVDFSSIQSSNQQTISAQGETELLDMGSNHSTVYPKAVVIPVAECDEVSFKTIQNFTSSVTNPFEIWCSLQHQKNCASHEIWTAFRNCEKIKGTAIILKISLDLDAAQANSFSYSFYAKAIQSKLDKIIKFRNTIRSVNSTIKNVIVNVRTISESAEKIDKNLLATIFCNEQVLGANQYYEAILQWANKNQMPVILKSAFDRIDKTYISSWMSVLRPPYSFYSSLNGFQQLRSSQPIFVVRNYPAGINGWKTDPCIPWINPNEIQAPNKFRQPIEHLGAVMKMHIHNERLLTVQEFQTMFQIVMSKFSLIELVFGYSSEMVTAVEAMNPEYLANLSTHNLSRRTKFFMNYNIEDGGLRPEKLPGLYKKFKEFQRNTLISVQGVHVHYDKIMRNKKERKGVSFEQMLISTNSRSHTHSLKIGLVIPEICMDQLQQAHLNETSDLNMAMKSVNYVVCEEVVDIQQAEGKVAMGIFFDTHLYIKKMLEKEYPGLSLYFKIKLDIDIDAKIKENMVRYKRFLKLCQSFGEAYGIEYFLVEAFDLDIKNVKRNGWWMITDYGDLTNLNVYVEKESGHAAWKPQRIINKSSSGSENTNESSNNFEISAPLILILLAGAALIIIVSFSCGLLVVYHHRKLRPDSVLTSEEVLVFLKGITEVDGRIEVGEIPVEHLTFNAEYELEYADVQIDGRNILGTGQSGIVYKGTVKELKAAIKIPIKNCGKETFKNTLGEVKVLCHLGNHEHIVSFLGAYVQEIRKGKLYIATSLCENGSLETFLRSKRDFFLDSDTGYANCDASNAKVILSSELKRFSLEIAKGMEYIASKNVVHGDLAARNVLLDSKFVCKVSDFGLSRKVYEYQKYTKTSQEPLPWKWMAYESLTKMEFTSMSDMWGYGVTAWEIFSLGQVPYAGLNWTPTFVDELRNNLRLPFPQLANQEIYDKLLQCWNLNPCQRPTFTQVVGFFQTLQSSEYENA